MRKQMDEYVHDSRFTMTNNVHKVMVAVSRKLVMSHCILQLTTVKSRMRMSLVLYLRHIGNFILHILSYSKQQSTTQSKNVEQICFTSEIIAYEHIIFEIIIQISFQFTSGLLTFGNTSVFRQSQYTSCIVYILDTTFEMSRFTLKINK